MYLLLNRYPKIQDATVRWLLAYDYYYGRNDAISQQLFKLRDIFDLKGIALNIEEISQLIDMPLGCPSNNDKEFFTRSLGILCLTAPSYWMRNNLLSDLRITVNVPIGTFQDSHCNEQYQVPSQIIKLDVAQLQLPSQVVNTDLEQNNLPSLTMNNDLVIFEQPLDMSYAESDNSIIDNLSSSEDIYFSFLPMYETCTKLGKSLGKEGQNIIRNGMRDIRTKLLTAHNSRDGRSGGAEHIYIPQTNINRMHKRKKKICSPVRRKK